GGPGARARGRRRGLYPERPRRGVRAARADPSRVPARRRCGARGHHVRGARRRRARPGPPGAARPQGLSRRGGSPHPARPDRAGAAHPVRPRRGGDAGRPALGRAVVSRRRRAHPHGGRRRQHRVAAPHDPRGARSARPDRLRLRSPHRVQRVRRSGQQAWLCGGSLWVAPPSVPGGGRRLGGGPRRPRQGDRRRRARHGVPRASIEGTTLPERATRRYARRGAPTVVFERQRRREGLMVVRTVEYFGFVLERDVEPLATRFPAELADAARAALVQALLAGETPHPDQGRLRRALERLGFYWRRSGGRLAGTATDQVAALLGAQLAPVGSWEEFLGSRLTLDVDAMI